MIAAHKNRDLHVRKVCLLGASFETGNMGVSALAETSIKCILARWPRAEIVLLGSGRTEKEYYLKMGDSDVCVRQLPIRLCPNVLLANHYGILFALAALLRLLPWKPVCCVVTTRNRFVKEILEADLIADITAGDSFSDIYGMRRFFFCCLPKLLAMSFGRRVFMLPQTYGPFDGRITRWVARHILRQAEVIYSRDQEGIECAGQLLNTQADGYVRFVPDIAFVLDPREPEEYGIEPSGFLGSQDSTVVGLNISGLLYHGGYTRNNMFHLKTDYRELVFTIVEWLLGREDVVVLLVPHVFPPDEFAAESDPAACAEIFDEMAKKYPRRVFVARGQYDHREIKYLIGLCDFFIGSRMHACIAALSQCVPAVGLAYSKKFWGVFESIGVGGCVADARHLDKAQLLEKIESTFKIRDNIRRHLSQVIPRVKRNILHLFAAQNGNKGCNCFAAAQDSVENSR